MSTYVLTEDPDIALVGAAIEGVALMLVATSDSVRPL